MPTIKAAQFPTVEREPRPTARPVTTPARPRVEKSQPARPKSKEVSTKASAIVRHPSNDRQAREEKLTNAIEVLRAKSVQFYHPDRSRVTRTVQLGQIIDIKI